MVKTFKGGIHPSDSKALTKDIAIADAPLPERIVLFMSQHIGAPCAPLVAKKDRVLTGQVIGKPQGFVSAPIHSSVTGTVVDVTDWPHPVLGKPMPDDGYLVDYLWKVVPDEAARNRILVDNPARLYGF